MTKPVVVVFVQVKAFAYSYIGNLRIEKHCSRGQKTITLSFLFITYKSLLLCKLNCLKLYISKNSFLVCGSKDFCSLTFPPHPLNTGGKWINPD
jgi:hypothetical protein